MPPPRPATDTRKPYAGPSRSLVIAIDVGTTFSGVSYAILEPGEIPKIHGVTRFPGQEHVAGNTKIPSVIYYDRHGKMMAAGAEADTSAIQAQAEDEGWIKAELFKLRLRPRTMQLNMNGMRFGPLPKRKTAVHVFGDFLAYLYRCTRNFITDTHANGASLWNQVESDLQFVLSHPNGWEGAQQSKMRRAAIYGGLIPETNEGKARIRFVTEGEASLHACVLNGLAADVLSNPSKHGFLIADAGGGTLDISAYAIKGASPLVIEEIAPPDCIFAGSVFVSRRARVFLEGKLKNSRYGTPDALDHITRRFDETTKRLFRDRRDLQFVPFGSPLDKDPTVGIRGGQLKLTGQEVADLFEPSVDAAFKAIKAQIEASQGMIRSVFLVGGYAASPWLFTQLQERLAPYRVVVSRPDTQTSKAVADGAIGFYCDHHVSARMSKFMYGVEFLREMDPRDPEHVARKERLCELPSGPKLLPDAFDCILARGVKVKESTVFTRKYCTELTSLSMLSVFEVEIWCYRGGNSIPKWINRQAENFSTLCVVRADLSPLAGSAAPKAGKNKTYWTIVFSVEIQFGLTEFRARIKWVDNGITKYGPASIIYNERGHRADEDEPDVFPEDEANTASASTTPRSAATDRIRSEPASRARTPGPHDPHQQQHIPPSSTSSSRRPSQSYPRSELSYASGTGGGVIPEVARVDRDRGRGERSSSSHNGHSPSPSVSVTSSSRNGYGHPNPNPSGGGGEYESDRKSSRSGRERERERERERATPRSTNSKIGETLSSVWGADAVGAATPGSRGIGGTPHSGTASPKYGSAYGATPSPKPGSTVAPGAETRSPWPDNQSLAPQTPSHHSSMQTPGHHSLQTPSHHSVQTPSHHSVQTPGQFSTRSMSSQHPSHHKSPYVETISTTIEPPKNLSPWDTVPSSLPRSVSRTPSQVERSEKDRMSGLWEDAPRSSYGDPPKTPWGGNSKTPSHVSRGLMGGEESTVLLAATTPAPAAPVEIPQSVSRSVSVRSKGVAPEAVVPPDVDDAPVPSQWGSATPKSVTATPGGGDGWDNNKDLASPAVTATPASSKIPKRSRKGSIAGSALSGNTAKTASPAKSPFAVPDAVGGESLSVVTGSPLGQQPSPHSKQVLSPLNPAAQETPVASMFGDARTPATPSTFGWGGGGGSAAAGGNDTWNTDQPAAAHEGTPAAGGDSWGFDNNNTSTPQQQPGSDAWGFNDPLPAATPALSSASKLKTPAMKTPKSLSAKTPKTPALEMAKTPKMEPAAEPVAETPTTPAVEESPMSTVGGKKKKVTKKGTAAAAAAAAAAEEEERKKREAEAEEERRRWQEEEDRAQADKAAEEEAEAAAAHAAAEAQAEAERLAKEEEERLEEEKLTREIAEAEAEAAREKAEKKEKEAKAAAAALADSPVKGKQVKKKGKKGAAANLWDDEEEKERERVAKEAREAEERAAKEQADWEAQEAAEREAQEQAEKAAEEARIKAEEEAKLKQAEEEAAKAKQAEEEAAKAKAEEEARAKAEQEAADAFVPAIKARGKKKKGQALNLWDDTEDKAKEEEARIAKEKVEEEAKEKERLAKEKADQEAKEKEEQERAQKEKEEKEKAEEAKSGNGEEPGSGSLFGGWGGASSATGGWGGLSSWGNKAKSKTPSISSGLGGALGGSLSGGLGGSLSGGLSSWGAPKFGSSFGGAFGVGSPEAQQEEFKLDHVGEPAKAPQSQSLFDDFSTSLVPPATFDTTALTFDTHTEAPPLGGKVPSRPPSRAPSPTPANLVDAAPAPAGPTEPAAEPTLPTAEPAVVPPVEEPPAPEAAGGEAQTANAEEEWGLPVKAAKKKKKPAAKKK